MKMDLSKFKLSKAAMNAVRGGIQECHCGGSTETVIQESDKFEDLEKSMDKQCGDAGWACRPFAPSPPSFEANHF